MSTGHIVALILGALVVGGVIWLIARARKVNREREAARQTAQRMAEPSDPLRRDYIGGDPRSIKLGDLIEWPGARTTYAVRGTVTLTEDGYTWQEHFTDPVNGAKRYVSVDPSDGDLEVVVWDEVLDFDIKPGQRQVVWDGVTYTRNETGQATYTTRGTTDLPQRGTVEYQDYRGRNGRRLSFERFNRGKWELSVGEVVSDGQLSIYPAS